MGSSSKIAERAGSSAGDRLVRGQSVAARFLPHAITVYIAAVFLDSLRFKFTDAPKTQIIFGDLDGWAGTFGAFGLFGHTGLFSQYVIGCAELVASSLLIVGILPRYRFLQPAGALLGLAIMSGAISFHLFTPLGVNVDGDGGALFFAACGVWVGALALLFLRRRAGAELARRIGALLAPMTKE